MVTWSRKSLRDAVRRTGVVLRDRLTAIWSTLAASKAPAALRNVEAQVAGQSHVRRPVDGSDKAAAGLANCPQSTIAFRSITRSAPERKDTLSCICSASDRQNKTA